MDTVLKMPETVIGVTGAFVLTRILDALVLIEKMSSPSRPTREPAA